MPLTSCRQASHGFDNISILSFLIRQAAVRMHTVNTGYVQKLPDSREGDVAGDWFVSEFCTVESMLPPADPALA
jgi:hypothetical protein